MLSQTIKSVFFFPNGLYFSVFIHFSQCWRTAQDWNDEDFAHKKQPRIQHWDTLKAKAKNLRLCI